MSPITSNPNVTLHEYLLKGMKNEQTMIRNNEKVFTR